MNILFADSHPTARRFAQWLLWCFLSIGLAACGGGDDAPAADAPPAITTQPVGTSVAAGQVASFSVAATGRDPLTYQWKKGGAAIDGATSASYTTPATVLADSGALFTVTVSNAAGSVTSDAATLTVGPVIVPVSITKPPAATSVVAGQTASFSVVATGTAPLTYQWKKNGAAIAGANAGSYTTAATLDADNGALFAVTVKNAANSVTSADAALTVTPVPTPATITTQPQSATVNSGQTATFNVVAGGSAPFTYQWSRNGTAIAGATAASYTTPVTVIGDTGATFRVVVTNAIGSLPSNTATLTVTAAPVMPAVTVQPASVSVNAGQAASFNVTATGTAPLSYQWRRDATPIAGATAATYTLAATSAADSGALFDVVVSNPVGSVTSHSATLTVGAPVAPRITTQPTSAIVTAPATVTFSVVATGSAPLAYQWRRNGSAIASANAATYTTPATSIAADNGAQFSVIVSNGTAPNATSANAVLTVQAAPVAPTIATQPTNAAVSVGATATFSVVANGSAPLVYRWRRNGADIAGATGTSYTTAPTVAADSGATFTVVVSNGTAPNATSNDATLTVNLVWTGIRQDGAPFPTVATQRASDAARAVATDAQGNVIIGGYTTGAFASLAGEDSPTAFVAKYSSAGTLLWARLVLDARNGFNGIEAVNSLAVDPAGNIYVTGEIVSALAGETAAGGYDVYVAKLDPNGNRLWAHRFGSPSDDHAKGIAVDSSGNAFVVGWSRDQLPGQPPPYNENYFIAKYDTNGIRLWLKEEDFTPANPDGDEAAAVAVDAAGNAYVAGMRGTNNGGLAPYAIYVVKYDGSGNLQWTGSLAAHSSTNPNYLQLMFATGIAVSADGSKVYVSGWTYADFDKVDNPPVAPNCCLQGDGFIAKFNGTGTLEWAHNIASQVLSGPRYFDEQAYAVSTDAAGSAAFVAGYTNGVMPGETSKGAEDIFVARYEASGARSWIKQLGSSPPVFGELNERAFAIALDPRGEVFVAGVTHGTFGTPLKDTDRDDWFVLKMKAADGRLY